MVLGAPAEHALFLDLQSHHVHRRCLIVSKFKAPFCRCPLRSDFLKEKEGERGTLPIFIAHPEQNRDCPRLLRVASDGSCMRIKVEAVAGFGVEHFGCFELVNQGQPPIKPGTVPGLLSVIGDAGH